MNNTKTIKALKAENKKLKAENAELEKRKKYGLVWEDKPEIFDEQSKNAFPILRRKDDKKYPDINNLSEKGNQQPHILIEGDNYHSLSVLNITYQNKIDVIYIDPPYNTGARDWKYNNDYVDKEDKFRHSKWLSFMEKRLKLAVNLLKDNGVICIAIDHYELFNLGLLCDEIFKENNRIGIVSVEHNPQGRTFSNFLSTTNEYYLFFAKLINNCNIYNLPVSEEDTNKYLHYDKQSKYKRIPLRKTGFASRKNDRPTQFFSFYYDQDKKILSLSNFKDAIEILPVNKEGEEFVWRISFINCKILIENNDIEVVDNNGFFTLYKKQRLEFGNKPKTIWNNAKYNASIHGAGLLKNILNSNKFNFPKSINAIKDVINMSSNNKNAIILDFFAGSGTTAHAVLELNKQDGGNRQCILATNNENGICEDITYQRVKRVIEGYITPRGKEVAGFGGVLHYLKTDFVPKTDYGAISDKDKINFSHQVGVMLALKENTFNEIKSTNHYQVFSSDEKICGIYFSESLIELGNLVDFMLEQNKPCYLYAYPELDEADFVVNNIVLSEIPEHILEIYKNIGVVL